MHHLPDDLRAALARNSAALETWDDIAPLARNKWICWVEVGEEGGDADQKDRLGVRNVRKGQRRPCCWPGCPHRGAGLKVEA